MCGKRINVFVCVCDDGPIAGPAIEDEGVRLWQRILKLVKFGLIASFIVDDMH